MKVKSLLSIIIVALLMSCASKIAVVNFPQYSFPDSQKSSSITKSDITIDVTSIRPYDMYDYPEYFSFNKDLFPENLKNNTTIKYGLKPSDDGKCWTYNFDDVVGKRLLPVFKVKITNKTGNIIRMKDARFYLIVEGEEPISSIPTINHLKETLGAFENEYAATHSSYPVGFYPAIIDQNRKSYKIISDVGREVLPDFSLTGLLVFPSIPSTTNFKLSFYDITTKTDAAGNPTEKTQFDFKLVSENGTMWFDRSMNKWKIGSPPVSSTK